MKAHFHIILLLLIVAAPASGQDQTRYNRLIKEADRYFGNEQYHLAAELYKEAIAFVTTAEVYYKLAECSRQTFHYPEAEAYYLQVSYTDTGNFPQALFYYALMLKLNGNLSESARQFERFIAFHQHNILLARFVEQAIIEKAGCEIAQSEFGAGPVMQSILLTGNVNSTFNDFAPAFRNNEAFVITSTRVASNRTLIDERNGEAFADNYYFEKTGDGWEDHTRQKFDIANSLYHDGPGSFTKNGDNYFFTVCEARCNIYETHLENTQWTKPVPLGEKINEPGSESKQPAVSRGGDTLYFASDRAGGYGGFDLWMSTRLRNNEWGKPVNLGKTINTHAHELAPAVGNDPSILFFSSNGHPGYGGFDFFLARPMAYDTAVYNLGLPFNSVRDDCFITFCERNIFWSSNRDGGRGGFDIYGGHKMSAGALIAKLSQKNRNDSRSLTLTSRTAQSENITLLASRNEETIDYNTLTYERKVIVNRMVERKLNDKQNNRQDYTGLSEEEFDMLSGIAQARFQTLLLKQKYASSLLTEVGRSTGIEGSLTITGAVISSQDGNPMPFARVLLTNAYGDILKITSTNERGQFRFTDVDDRDKLFLRLQTTSGRNHSAFVQGLQMLASDRNNALYVENVYFDFDHYTIRPEARQVLTELAAFLKANLGAQVEIYAFADDRGSSAYNFELTQKRGEAVAAFLTSEGVGETSLAIIPKGKQQIQRVATGVERQYNRRAEIYINGVKEAATRAVKTYIVKKETYWDVIAKLTGIAEEKLRDLNGAQTEMVKAFQPIRLPADAKSISDAVFFVGI